MSRVDRHTTARLVAARFVRSTGSRSIINIMSWVSVVAVGVPVAAMVILMSVFNGFDEIVRGMFSDFEPELTISPTRGTTMTADESLRESVLGVEGVQAASFVLDGEALLTYGPNKSTATVRGVDSEFMRVVAIEEMIRSGHYRKELWEGQCIVGQGVAYSLGLRAGGADSVWFYLPSRGTYSKLMPTSGVNMAAAKPTAIFALDADTDGKYVLCPMEMARELMDAPEGASALKIRLNEKADIEELQTKIEQLLPDGVRVQSRAELAGSMYRVLDVEKMAVLLIGIMILVVASFSVVGTLTMIIIDKRDSIATLRALGADTAMIRSIFTRQGVSICMLGAVCGFVLGVALSLVQQHFGVIEIPAESFLIKAYPVKVVVSDLVVVVAAFSGVSLAMAYLTVRGRIKNENR